MRIIKLILIFSFCLLPQLEAEETKRIVTIAEIKGTVEIKIGKEAWGAAQLGVSLNQGDSIRTRANSSAVLSLDGEEKTANVEIKQNSQLRLAELLENKEEASQNTLLDLSLGEILIKAQKLDVEKSRFEVKTPTSIVGVRGTAFSVAVEAVE